MRIVSITSPLLTLSLLLTGALAYAQPAPAEVTDEELTPEEQAEAEAAAAEEGDIVATEAAPPSEPAQAEEPAAGEQAEAPMSDGEGVWEPGQEPNRPAPAGKGVIWGRVVDTQGEPAVEAEVKVAGTKTRVYTDLDGYYRLELPPGKYTLELFYELHEPVSLQGVASKGGQLSRVDSTLTPQAGAIEEVTIQDAAETQTVAGLAIARQNSASQGDAVGREEIQKTADTNAAMAARRVVGANIVGGRFVYVRGLGERYSNSLLSMYPLPSPEPDRAAVPLDVFPAAVLDSLTIAKTFTPDMPGDFAGGSVQIETRSVPEKPLFQVNIQGGLNTQSTFQNRLDTTHSSTDFLGFDSGMRAMPSSIPTDHPVTSQDSTPEEVAKYGQDMNSPMSNKSNGTPPNQAFSAVGGNTWTFGGGQKLGVLASVNYRHQYEKFDGMIQREFQVSGTDPRGFEPRIDYKVDRGLETVRAGMFGKVSYLPASGHEISLTGFHSQASDSTASYFYGYNNPNQNNYSAVQQDWVQRGLTFGLLSGRHELPDLNGAQLDWDASLAGATRYQPDRRDTVYAQSQNLPDADGSRARNAGWSYANKTDSGRHFWSQQDEFSRGGKVDWRQPLIKGDTTLDLKFGGLANLKDRNFSVRRFRYVPTALPGSPQYNCLGDQFQQNCPDSTFTDQNVAAFMRLEEGSQDGDAYTAKLNVFATYAMLDFDLGKRLRLVAGPRVEWTEQTINPTTPFGTPSNLTGANLQSTDVLPAISAVFSATKELKTRFSYTKTLARPQLRELAPFAFADYFGGRTVTGNPDLVLTRIDNIDARIEYWTNVTDVLAFTTFYKHLDKPIETILVPTPDAPQVTFVNAKAANLIGAEFEVRKGLGFLTPILQDFTGITNFTYAWSRTEVDQTGFGTITNPSRALINQAPWVFNVALDYENEVGTGARINYNVSGPTLVEVGTDGIPDAYQQPFSQLDLQVSQKLSEHWNVQLMAQNLLNSAFVVTQGKDYVEENITRRFTTGSTFWLGFGYSL